jgi:diacylglycerol kinase (ATP)
MSAARRSDRRPGLIDLPKAVRSFRYAGSGVRHFFRVENNARIHLAASILAVALGCYLGLERVEWAVLALTIAAVWAAEAFNTAIERLVDLVQPEHDPRAGAIKDLAAAAVLFASWGALGVGAFLFLPRVIALW